MDDREHEIREVRGDAEKFLAPVLPLLQAWRESLALQGITLSHDLFVGPYPVNAPQNPVKAGLHVQVKGVERYTWGTVFVLDHYQPEHADWLAAEIEFAIEEELASPDFGRLTEEVVDLDFAHVLYDRENDHEHCSCCGETIAATLYSDAGELVHEASPAYVSQTPSSEVWLCPRCFEYWAPRRDLTEA